MFFSDISHSAILFTRLITCYQNGTWWQDNIVMDFLGKNDCHHNQTINLQWWMERRTSTDI